MKYFWLALSLVSIVLAAVIFSHHGLWELRRFQAQVAATLARANVLEEENRLLKKRLDLLLERSPVVTERLLREWEGLVEPGERLYVHKAR
jgi:cell division protein FtsB